MLRGKCLKGAGVLTLFFFMFFLISADFALANQEDDALLKARRMYQQGDYEGSIKLLGDFITKLRAMVEQKKNVAEAFYLLAKIYYEVGDDVKVDENLRKCYETYPAFSMEETNLGFKDRVDRVRKEVLEAKTMQQPEEEQEPTTEEMTPAPKKRVIEQTTYPKKKKKFPALLVVGGIVVVAVVLALVLKKKDSSTPEVEVFDIRGDWTVIVNFLGTDIPFYINYSGSLTNGTFVDQDGDTGTYTVNNRTVHFEYDYYVLSFDGSFTGQDTMNGNYETDTTSGSWRGTRGFSLSITHQTNQVKSQTTKKN
jgi:hypothetical protein